MYNMFIYINLIYILIYKLINFYKYMRCLRNAYNINSTSQY